jgi:hypothetical protein
MQILSNIEPVFVIFSDSLSILFWDTHQWASAGSFQGLAVPHLARFSKMVDIHAPHSPHGYPPAQARGTRRRDPPGLCGRHWPTRQAGKSASIVRRE